MKRVLVFGARGMLGRAVSMLLGRRDYHVVALTRAQLDLARSPADALRPHVAEVDAVINCAAVIKSAMAGVAVEEVLRVNCVFPRNLAQLCAERRIPCLHVASDGVFSGRRGQYHEGDLFEPEDLYTLSKCAGDVPQAMTLRTSVIGEEDGTCRSLLEWARSQTGKTVKGFTNHLWNGLTTVQLAQVMHAILEQSLYTPGIFHIHAPDTVSKYELLKIISEAYGLELAVQPVQAERASDRSLRSLYPLSSRLVPDPIATQVRVMRTFFA